MCIRIIRKDFSLRFKSKSINNPFTWQCLYYVSKKPASTVPKKIAPSVPLHRSY